MAGSEQTMNMQTKPQCLRIVATRASPPTSLQHSSSSWRATWMLRGPLQCLDTVCCRWQAALIDTKLITTFSLSDMLNGSYPEHQPLYVGLFAPLQKAYSVVMQDGVVMQDYTRKTCTGIAKKLFFSFVKANTKAAWRPVGIQQPPSPPPPQP